MAADKLSIGTVVKRHRESAGTRLPGRRAVRHWLPGQHLDEQAAHRTPTATQQHRLTQRRRVFPSGAPGVPSATFYALLARASVGRPSGPQGVKMISPRACGLLVGGLA